MSGIIWTGYETVLMIGIVKFDNKGYNFILTQKLFLTLYHESFFTHKGLNLQIKLEQSIPLTYVTYIVSCIFFIAKVIYIPSQFLKN